MYADNMPSFQWHLDMSDKTFHCDTKINDILGLHADEKMTIAQLLGKIDKRQVERVKVALTNAIHDIRPFKSRIIFTGEHKNRYLIDFEIVSSSKNSISGKITFLLLFPTQSQETELLNLLFKNGSKGFVLASSDHIILMVNKALCVASGYSEGELIGQHTNIFKSGEYTKEFYIELWNKVDLNESWHGELIMLSKTGKIYSNEVHLQRVQLSDNSYFYLSASHKITDLSNTSNSDDDKGKVISSVMSKINYIAALQSVYKNITPEQTIVMASFNIKMLQKTNATTKIWLISQRFNKISNNNAAVIGTLNIDSFNDSVFSIFWIESKGIDHINKILHATLCELAGQHFEDDLSLSSIINMGVSVLNIDAQSPEQLIKNSMQVLVANPMLNESTFSYFDARLSKRFDNRKILALQLREALDHKQISVFYQPIISIPLLHIVGFEALARFNLKTDIEYDTQLLIQIAEEYNWIDEVDSIVANIALKDLNIIQDEYNQPNLGMSINRSLVNDTISKCSLEQTILILESSNVNFNKITIELIESARFANVGQQKQWVEKLKKMGTKIAIDDFGQGSASFDYLEMLPIDYIKIASNFISGLTLNSRKYSVIVAITNLAHKIGAKIIAEGVETETELTLLSRANVDQVQGYLFAKPTSLGALIKNKDKCFPSHLKPLIYNETVSTVRDIALKSFSTIDMDDRLDLVIKKMESTDVDYLVILEKTLYQGILIRADIDAAISPYLGTKVEQMRDLTTLDKRVHQVMKNIIHSLHIDSPISKAEQLFLDFPKAIIILFETEGTCVAVTTIEELLRNKLKIDNHENIDDSYFI